MLTVYTDGASIGNPGKVGIGYVIYENDKIIKEGSVYLGVQTNNFAEYMALVFALIDVIGMGKKECQVFADSQLLCEQINGNYKVKNNNIFPLFVLAKTLIGQLDKFKISHIGREKNKEADKLSKKAAGFLV
ncbi:MAG: ribonuclease HI family protein [Candidatus Omnitrophica bacterium]|nr:ribonuclease HI family protein [Candidatus Omnitrophota bacterium]